MGEAQYCLNVCFQQQILCPAWRVGGKAIWPNKSAGDASHPAMAFTQESERTANLQPAIVGNGKRYAISLTTECLLDFREVFMMKALGLTSAASASHCPTQ